MRPRQALALVILTLHAGTSLAVEIPRADRVRNLDPGCCTWASLETAGNFMGIAGLKGVTRARRDRALEVVAWSDGVYRPRGDNGGTLERVRDELAARGVRCRVQQDGLTSTRILYDAVRSGRPVSISLRGYPLNADGSPDWSAYHAVLLTDITADGKVTVIDPNHPGDDRHFGRPWLFKHWTGRAVLLEAPAARRVGPATAGGGDLPVAEAVGGGGRAAAPGLARRGRDPVPVSEVSRPPPAPGADRPPRRDPAAPALADDGPPPAAAVPLMVRDDARRESLAAAIRRGRASCVRCLVDDFGMSDPEARAAAARIWGDSP